MRRRPVLAAAVLAAAAMSCSSDLPGRDADEGPSFACVAAVQRTGFTQGTPVGEARDRIESFYGETGAPLSPEERAFWDAHLDRLQDLDDDAPIGEALNGIPCDL